MRHLITLLALLSLPAMGGTLTVPQSLQKISTITKSLAQYADATTAKELVAMAAEADALLQQNQANPFAQSSPAIRALTLFSEKLRESGFQNLLNGINHPDAYPLKMELVKIEMEELPQKRVLYVATFMTVAADDLLTLAAYPGATPEQIQDIQTSAARAKAASQAYLQPGYSFAPRRQEDDMEQLTFAAIRLNRSEIYPQSDTKIVRIFNQNDLMLAYSEIHKDD